MSWGFNFTHLKLHGKQPPFFESVRLWGLSWPLMHCNAWVVSTPPKLGQQRVPDESGGEKETKNMYPLVMTDILKMAIETVSLPIKHDDSP